MDQKPRKILLSDLKYLGCFNAFLGGYISYPKNQICMKIMAPTATNIISFRFQVLQYICLRSTLLCSLNLNCIKITISMAAELINSELRNFNAFFGASYVCGHVIIMQICMIIMTALGIICFKAINHVAMMKINEISKSVKMV